jgi:hypothetical protein
MGYSAIKSALKGVGSVKGAFKHGVGQMKTITRKLFPQNYKKIIADKCTQ